MGGKRVVLFFLLLMSLISWYYIFYNFFYLRNFKKFVEKWKYNVENLKEISLFLKEVRSAEDDFSKKFKKVYGEIR